MLRYLVVVKYPSGQMNRAQPVCESMHEALGLCRSVKQRASGATFIILKAATDNGLDDLYTRLLNGEVEAAPRSQEDLARSAFESGHGGDQDTTYTFTPSRFLPTRLAWARLAARVARAELGGAHDGALSRHHGSL